MEETEAPGQADATSVPLMEPEAVAQGIGVRARGDNTTGDWGGHSGRGGPCSHFAVSINGGLRRRFCLVVPASGQSRACLAGKRRRCTGKGERQVMSGTDDED
ncbi:hypothetical protein GUJ93_ZPchr0008g12206 [Zizania palustris]|uniref:Uncharacterized protein n=1 Tax=Zizania palustris TaxID=103762 RepID=A0A8J5V4W6_ZIZPA|nr:hypothetical protein GUJ93_ZPchr0008g12206 [Zizania palustris]